MKVSKLQKKRILADPVSLFAQRFPSASETQLSDLDTLQRQYLEVKTQLKAIQTQSKKLSRQIGDAKHTDQPTEPLIYAMQELGRNKNKLNTNLDQLSENILAYFKPDKKNGNTTTTASLPPARIHGEPKDDNEKISIALLSDEFDAWNKYVDSNPAASLYHRAEWKELIQKIFGHECFYFYASNSQKIVGVLPLVRLKSFLFGDFMVSMPYFNYGGAIASNLLIERELMGAANDLAKSIGTNHIEYRDDIVRNSLPVRTDKVNMILSLPDYEDRLWNSFPSKLRSQIKRAQREKVQINIGGADHLADFYTVFAQNMRDLGTPVYGKTLFSDILLTFPEETKIITIRYESHPVAAAFVIGHKNMLEIPWASTVKTVNPLSINMLLYWEVLKFAINNRYRYFDFGRSSRDSGTFRFKQQWGAKPKQLHWHYWLPDNIEMPKLNPENPRYSLAISIWKKLPVFLTKILGPYIVKNLP